MDALVGALATAFFGSIGALAVILLQRVMRLEASVHEMHARLDTFKDLEGTMRVYGRKESAGLGADDVA